MGPTGYAGHATQGFERGLEALDEISHPLAFSHRRTPNGLSWVPYLF